MNMMIRLKILVIDYGNIFLVYIVSVYYWLKCKLINKVYKMNKIIKTHIYPRIIGGANIGGGGGGGGGLGL